jgi:hypothetical protein
MTGLHAGTVQHGAPSLTIGWAAGRVAWSQPWTQGQRSALRLSPAPGQGEEEGFQGDGEALSSTMDAQ